MMQTAVAQYLEKCTGIRAAEEKSKAAGYPVLTVTVRETGSVLVDGGRQAERSYAVTVRAVSDREREGKTALLMQLSAAVLAGIPMEGRVLHPLDVKTEGDALTFTVTLCTLLPQTGTGDAEVMETINLNL